MSDTLDPRFDLLLTWWNRDTSTDFVVVKAEMERILREHGIRLRQQDGELMQINFSLPRSHSGLVLGLRYRKRDRSLTEDHFLCTQSGDVLRIEKYYRGDLEDALREYLGTHKAQLDLTTIELGPQPVMTDVRTISFTKPIK